MTAVTRVIRTAVQAIVAVAIATPTITQTLHLSVARASEITGIAAAFVVVVSAVQNALETKGIVGTQKPAVTPPTV